MISFDRDLVFVDVETLGLDREAPIWEFAAIRLGPGDTEPSQSPVVLQILHQPDHWLDTLPEAFAADYRARHYIQIAIPRAQAAREIHAITDGAIIAGSNPSFDTERLGMLLAAHGITPGWHYHPLDIPSMIARSDRPISRPVRQRPRGRSRPRHGAVEIGSALPPHRRRPRRFRPPHRSRRRAVVPGAVAGHERRMTAYTAFLALVRDGFRPPTGAGRCRRCACHVATQGHRDGCPERGK